MAVCPNCHETNPEAGAKCPRCPEHYYVPEESVEEAASDPIVGTMVADKYVILGLISEGGMGAVYRALQMPVEREVAFKVLRTELKDSDNGRDRFIREARAVSRLNHPNIITLYDFGFEDGKHPYMVMEYAPGKSLSGWLRSEPVTIDRILRVTVQILSALNEAHSHGIVHRDLKPENMIVSPKGDLDRVKLLDFGIARMVNEGSTRGLTREGEVFGTPHYMAPEQAQGKKDIGPPADVYAVGIMLWEMLCGRCPYDAPTPLAVLFMHINDPLPPLEPLPTVNVPPQLVYILEKATAKEPMHRYQSANEMMTDLSNLIVSITGSHPAGLVGEISQEFMLGSSGDVTPPPAGWGPNTNTPQPGRGPHFTPMTGNISGGVNVVDPDLTGDVSRPVAAYQEQDGIQPPATEDTKLGIVAIGGVIAFLAIFAVLVTVLMSSNDDADVDATETPVANMPTDELIEPEKQAGESAEVAIKEERVNAEVEVEPIETAENVEADAKKLAAAADKDKADDEKEKVTAKEGTTPKKRTTRKRVTKKTETNETTPRKTTPKKTEKKTTSPTMWAPKVQKKDKEVKPEIWGAPSK